MSFILDALKKSENERQRQAGPSLADIPVRRARTERPWWAVAVAALLVVNLGVLIVVLLRDRSAPEPVPLQQAPTLAAAPASRVPSAAMPAESRQAGSVSGPALPSAAAQAGRDSSAATGAARPSPAVQSLAEAAGAGMDDDMDDYRPSIAGAAVMPAGPPVVRSITPPTVAPLADQPSFAARERSSTIAAIDEMLPTHGSLVASGTHLPEMRLDIHVFSPNQSERFVFVNMRKYVEGQTLSEGAALERITTDGAILNYQGTRFLLPRQ